MKIAFVVPYVPNLIRTRPYNLIVHLTSLGHEVEVFTVGSGAQDLLDVEALRKKCKAVHFFYIPLWRSLWNSVLAVPSSQPLQTVFSWHGGMAEKLAYRIAQKEFDVVHVEHLRGSQYARFVKAKFPTLPVVWDSVDCISHLFQQASGQSSSFFGKFVTRFELPRTRKAEGNLICSFDHTLVTSSADKSALLALKANGRSTAPMSVLPNGVDLEYFQPNPEIQREPETIVFSGKMSYHANIAMVKGMGEASGDKVSGGWEGSRSRYPGYGEESIDHDHGDSG
jgi:glycosyltransferase involved in cell wall biosynthesis